MTEPIRTAPSPAGQLADLWQRGRPPDVVQFLTGFPEVGADERLAVLRVDQGERWQRGERPLAESYRDRLPDLAADADRLLDLIYSEIVLRESLGESPRLEEYRERFPQFAPQLQRQFALDHAMNWDSLLRPAGPSSSSEAETLPVGAASPKSGLPDTVPGEESPDVPGPVAVPGYTILSELGRGGMGVVYKARHGKLQRIVALKMILAGAQASREVLARFRHEAEAVARLQHPNIVQVFEVGEHEGRPFLALEFVEGGSLADRQNGTPLPPPTAAGLLETLARAVHHAHQRGVVHRDLKPANILLASGGHEPPDSMTPSGGSRPPLADLTPKITDFGLAKRLDGASQTQSGAIVGTPSYMAPEQAQGQGAEVGPAADIYALGAILYELLTGRPPFKAASSLDTVMQVIAAEPVPVRRLQPKVPRDLETICLKCLEKEPRKRYLHAEALADDLRRFQNNEPIHARPVGPAGRLVKAVRRRPALSALMVALFLVPVLGFAGVFWHLKQTQQDQEQTRAALDRAEYHLYLNHIALADREWRAGNVDRAEQLLARCPEKFRGWEWHYLKRLCHLELRSLPGAGGFGVAYSPDGRWLASASAHDQTVRVLDVQTGKALFTCPQEGPCVAFNRDASLLGCAGLELGPQGNVLDRPAAVKVWDLRTGKEVLSLGGAEGHQKAVWAVAFSPDGKRLASAGWDGVVKIWEIPSGKLLLTFQGHSQRVESVAFHPDGRRVASAEGDGTVLLWDAGSGKVFLRINGRTSSASRVGPELKGEKLPRFEKGENLPRNEKGESFARAESARPRGWDLTRKVWDATGSTEVLTLRGQTHEVHAVAFSPDGTRLALTDGTAIRIWDVSRQGGERELFVLRGHTDQVRAVAFSPDGKRLASAGYDRAVKVWDVEKGTELFTLHGHTAPVNGVAFRPDGQRLASAGWDRRLLVWDATASREVRAFSAPGKSALIRSVAFHPDGRHAAAGRADGTIAIWDTSGTKPPRLLKGHDGLVRSVAFSPDGKLLVSAGYDHTVRVWDVESGTVLRTFRGHGDRVFAAAFSPDGRRIASAGQEGKVLVWDRETGRVLLTFSGHTGRVHALAFSPDGRRIASVGDDRKVRVWDADTGREIFALPGHTRDIMAVVFSPDGKRLASTGLDQTVRVWDALKGRKLHVLEGHTEAVLGLAFSPDGKRLASASLDRTIKLWDPAAGQEVLTLRGLMGELFDVAFSRDGTQLASGGADGRLLVWGW